MPNQVAYGFVNLQDIFSQRVLETPSDIIDAALDRSLEEHNRQIGLMYDVFTTTTEVWTERYRGIVNERLQPLDQNGRARPTKGGNYISLAYPLFEAGSAWGANWKSMVKMTVGDMNRVTLQKTVADVRWNRDQIFSALFTPGPWTFADPVRGDLTIKGLASGDSDTYLQLSGADNTATDNHYLFHNNPVATGTDPTGTIRNELVEHPENDGEAVLFVPTNLKSAYEGLAAFNPLRDTNIQPGASQDVVTGTLGAAVPGEVFGYHDSKIWLVEWKSLPDNYLVAVTTGGERPLARRQEPEPELQGFRLVAERNDHPWNERQWYRAAGYGGRNRVGAVVCRVGAAAYAVPTNYTAPIA